MEIAYSGCLNSTNKTYFACLVSSLVEEALWKKPCGRSLVEEALWKKPCGKCDVKKILEHVKDNEMKVRCQDTKNYLLWMLRIKYYYYYIVLSHLAY